MEDGGPGAREALTGQSFTFVTPRVKLVACADAAREDQVMKTRHMMRRLCASFAVSMLLTGSAHAQTSEIVAPGLESSVQSADEGLERSVSHLFEETLTDFRR